MKTSLPIRFAFALGVTVLARSVAAVALPPPSAESLNGEFQFSATFNNQGIDGNPAHDFTAYLWIPPSAENVRAVIATQQNVGEQPFTEDPAIRAACARNRIAILWCSPAIDLRFEAKREEAAQLLEHVLHTLAERSGYAEIGTVPWITFGHSTTTQFARSLAEARPDRTLAIISAKGGVKLAAATTVPGIYSGGHYPEWRQPTHDWTTNGTVLGGLVRFREDMSQRWRPVSFVEEFGGGHFDYSRRYRDFLALYIDKVVQHRLQADGSLRNPSPEQGWIVDVRPPLPTAPLRILRWSEATAEQRHGPWYFDRELAEAAVAVMDNGHWERKNQIVAWANLDGTPATFFRSGIVDPVPCEFDADGVTITRMATTFLDQLPDNFTQAGMKLSHATTGPRTIESISGVFAVRDGGYRLELNRGWPQTPNFIAVRHSGDEQHRPSVQPGRFVPPVYQGRAQRIDFSLMGDQPAGEKAVRLRATSSAGLQVRYFVRSGPARIVDDTLVLLPLPPRTRFPVKVTVVAWQLGQGGNAPVAAAPLVEQTFALTSAGNATPVKAGAMAVPGSAAMVQATRAKESPIIRDGVLPGEEGASINGPSLIRVPDWVPRPLGRYYLYFAHHAGKSIRLAYADRVEGPWKIHDGGVQSLESQSAVEDHIASPDVIVDPVARQIYLFYHGWVPAAKKSADPVLDGEDGQWTAVSVSRDGVNFTPLNRVVGPSYLRVFAHGGQWYALNHSGVLRRAAKLGDHFDPVARVIGGEIIDAVDPARRNEPGATPADQRPTVGPLRYAIRHIGLDVVGDRLVVFFTCVGHRPERILATSITLQGPPESWRARGTVEILRPGTAEEGADLPLAYSRGGISPTRVNELRDPAVYREGPAAWLLYSIAGEHGIGLARLHYDER